MLRFVQLLFVLVGVAALGACEPWPRDSNNTTEMVLETGTLRVGVIHNPPWTDTNNDKPDGHEIQIVEAFAQSLGVEPEWQSFGTHDGFKALERGELDLLAGGLVKATPYKSAGFTRPYENSRSEDGRTLKHVLAVRRGENRFLVILEQFLKQREGVPE